MEKAERRAEKERRITDDRRLMNTPFHQGSKQRKILDRRCGIDRRQIFKNKTASLFPCPVLPYLGMDVSAPPQSRITFWRDAVCPSCPPGVRS